MAWPWNPGIPLLTDQKIYKVTASDAENAGEGCDLAAALKVRLATDPDNNGWQRRKSNDTFTLGPLTTAIARVHRACARGVDLNEALDQAKTGFGVAHRGWRRFLDHSLERYFEYHESREQELGPLHYIDLFNEVTIKRNSTIMTWGPMYENGLGTREIRRLRFDRARRAHTAWVDVAAYVAAEVDTGRPVQQVFVTEVGLFDGSDWCVVEGVTPEQARATFQRAGRPKAQAVVEGVVRTPGQDCDGCKFTGGCPDLFAADGMLQLDKRAAWSRSVSAIDLNLYELCASRWYMQRLLHLPRENEEGEALKRGMAVHSWIKHTHSRRIACQPEDLPEPIPGLTMADEVLSDEDYRLARPYLIHHVETCPFSIGELDIVHTERNIYGRDTVSDVVVAAKPDLVFRDGNTLIVREVKTSQGHLPVDATDARDVYLQVSFDLLLLEHGLAERHGCSRGEVQLEVLTPHGGAVFTYATDDVVTMKIARRRIKELARDWADDAIWNTKPGGHCARCPVRQWCPDRDAHAANSDPDSGAVDDDEPPF